MSNFVQNGLLIIFLFFGFQATAQETIWLSNTPPDTMKNEVRASGMHRISSLINKKTRGKSKKTDKKNKNTFKKPVSDSINDKGNKVSQKKSKKTYRRAPTKYIHWLREGNSVKKSNYVNLADSVDYQLQMMSPEGKKSPIELVKGKATHIKFELNEEGYYNAYFIVKKGRGDTLYVNIAKAELLSHSCRNGHHKKLEARPVRYYPEITEFEIIRKRHPHEDYHFFTASGDFETYQALLDGKPLADVQMTVNTLKGWSKTATTDEKGEYNIQFIQDYFSKWEDLNKRKIYYYMLQAEYTQQKEAHYKGIDYNYIHYTLTMSDGYRPAKTMYLSMFWGLIVFVIAMIVSVAGIFFYKERRKKPYKEIIFNESNT